MRVVGTGTTSLLDYINGGDTSNTAMLSALQAAQKNKYAAAGANSGINTGNATTDKYLNDMIKKSNEACDATKDAALSLREHGEALSAAGKDSLLAKAEASGSTKDVVSEIKGFIESYNVMITNMKKNNDTVNKAYDKQLTEEFETHKEALEAVGIKANEDGTLSVDEKVLEGASLEELKALFGKSDSFLQTVSAKSIYIEAHAVSVKSKNAYMSQTANYNANGNTNYDATDNLRGRQFNSKQ